MPLLMLMIAWAAEAKGETGYDLWLRYAAVTDNDLLKEYRKVNRALMLLDSNPTAEAVRSELNRGFEGMTGESPAETNKICSGTVIVGTAGEMEDVLDEMSTDSLRSRLSGCGDEGYGIFSMRCRGKSVTLITGNTWKGVLYGTFRYLRLMQTGCRVTDLDITDAPKLTYRVLNHWDNLNGTVERGYAGYSLWNWERLPYIKPGRLTDYARANASIGINGIVINNVNAQAVSLRHDWLVKAAGLAEVFRPYGIRIYLTAKFSAPKEIGGLSTADPLDPDVSRWWRDKAEEIYRLIPDFGGFLVKANSEGQPGPQDYGRTHADGANMLGEALKPFGGVVFWRAFVYQNERDIDRVVTGYNEFKPLDGQFMENVFVQPKNGPIDFQPREPFHPLFGAMPDTPLAMEVQITQENLGHAGHLVYLGTLYEEVLQSDTYTSGEGSTVSRILQGYGVTHGMSAIAGVPNVGTDLNWTGHPFGQANWYAFGRLAWNPDGKAGEIADEWIRMTFSNDNKVVAPVHKIMMMSREAYVDYTMPLGLNHIMNYDTHNGPEPWHHDPWWSAYDYHRITADSIGVDRTWCAASTGHTGSVGSGATRQYSDQVFRQFDSLDSCPDEYLLWFHRLPFSYRMRSGKSLWEELVAHYYGGVSKVEEMQQLWTNVTGIDSERHAEVSELLEYQKREAEWWRDGCLLFYRSYNHLPLPAGYAEPPHPLDYYKRIPFPYDW
jgi:alpha-glucuronidase